MKKSIFCLILVLCLCLCAFLVSCKPDEPENTDQPGQIHTTPDNTPGVGFEIGNPVMGDDTARY